MGKEQKVAKSVMNGMGKKAVEAGKKYMALEERLTPKERIWIGEYLESGDGTKATEKAYGTSGQIAWNRTYLNRKKFMPLIEKAKEAKKGEFYDKVGAELGKNVDVAVKVRDGVIDAKQGAIQLAAAKVLTEWSGEGSRKSEVKITHQFQKLFDEVGFGDSEVVEATLVNQPKGA